VFAIKSVAYSVTEFRRVLSWTKICWGDANGFVTDFVETIVTFQDHLKVRNLPRLSRFVLATFTETFQR